MNSSQGLLTCDAIFHLYTNTRNSYKNILYSLTHTQTNNQTETHAHFGPHTAEKFILID